MNQQFAQSPRQTYPIRLEVRKEGHLFYGDLVWSDGNKWMSWQSGFRTITLLTQSARCTFDGEIIRV